MDVLVLIASADGEFQDEEKKVISKVMEQVGISADSHPYFSGDSIDIAAVKKNVNTTIEKIKELK